jgi:hypothetical protein
MDAPGAVAATWEARRLGALPRLRPVRWGVVHVPTGRCVAFGSEARCRQMAAHLAEVDAILTRPAIEAAGRDARR